MDYTSTFQLAFLTKKIKRSQSIKLLMSATAGSNVPVKELIGTFRFEDEDENERDIDCLFLAKILRKFITWTIKHCSSRMTTVFPFRDTVNMAAVTLSENGQFVGLSHVTLSHKLTSFALFLT